jgi:3-dehydroquinate synthase
VAEIKVSAEREYTVKIAGDWRGDLSPLLRDRSRVAVIQSAAMKSLIAPVVHAQAQVVTIEVPDGEAGKSAQVAQYIWSQLAEHGFTRGDLIVAIGGGTITDVAGFAAATMLRGIDWVAVPTTMAGMVDASVGGKTGINSPFGKNLIGAFHSPVAVLIDHNWLSTLSDRDFAAGLAEVVKCGFISDAQILSLVEGRSITEIRRDNQRVIELIERSVQVKASVVSQDFKESHLREILNYGHTFGHAIERISDYSIRHGEAVAIGMIYVAELAHSRGLIDGDLLAQHRAILSSLNLPVALGEIAGSRNWDALRAAMALDKKSRGDEIRFVALDAVTSCVRIDGVTDDELKSAYEKVLS